MAWGGKYITTCLKNLSICEIVVVWLTRYESRGSHAACSVIDFRRRFLNGNSEEMLLTILNNYNFKILKQLSGVVNYYSTHLYVSGVGDVDEKLADCKLCTIVP